tara:strand:- start:4672 stop:5082 length:411 start_codon:yes stop_codon:yes gene_type:complete
LKKTKEKEHYLKEIYKLVESDEKVSVSQLSLKLGVSKSSVSNMLKKLVSMGLVSTGPYKPILLTKKGNNLSKKIVAKHRLIESFLVDVMGFSSNEVHEIAEEIEHINSPEFFRKVKSMVNAKTIDPHGSSIPDVDF